MKKTIESEIRQIATELSQQSIQNTALWKEKVWNLYDKLCVLDYLEQQLNLTESSIEADKNLVAVDTSQISDTEEEISGELDDIFNEVSHLQEEEQKQLSKALAEADKLVEELEEIEDLHIEEEVEEDIPPIDSDTLDMIASGELDEYHKEEAERQRALEKAEAENAELMSEMMASGELDEVFNEIHREEEERQKAILDAEVENTRFMNELHESGEMQRIEEEFRAKQEEVKQVTQTENLLFSFDEEEIEEINTPVKKSDELQRFAEQYPSIPTFSRKEETKEESVAEEKPEIKTEVSPEPTPSTEAVSNYENTFVKAGEARARSLNESINRGLHIGINDRLAFQKHLFDNSPDDFNRVLSQINSFQELSVVMQFIEQHVKPEYNNWEGKEDFEARFINLVEKKFI